MKTEVGEGEDEKEETMVNIIKQGLKRQNVQKG